MNNTNKLDTQPYKGTRDFYPEQMRLRDYMFNTFRKVAYKYGFEEYDAPLLESFDIYVAKTGEEIVNTQLYSFTDRGDRKVALRPEKTPSVARMVAAKSNELTKPIKWFNIGRCWRYESPQKGRKREFFQFDCDIFGIDSVIADVEVLSIPVEVMLALGATEQMFEIRISNRRLAEYYLREVIQLKGGISKIGSQMYKVGKAVDSRPKISKKEFIKLLEKENLDKNQIDNLVKFLEADLSFLKDYQEDCYGAEEILTFFKLMEQRNLARYFKFSPEILRGLDYYSGNVIEQFDLNPKNKRSMFGGGRYDNLVDIFSDETIPGVGFAMGDVPLIEFLKGWKLIPKFSSKTQVLVTIFDKSLAKEAFNISKQLRQNNVNTELFLENKKLPKQLKYADNKAIPFVIIQGPDELKKNKIMLKDMSKGEQEMLSLEEAITKIRTN